MTTTETGERFILRILVEHLEVTKALLESYTRVAVAVKKNPAFAPHLPAFPETPALTELHSSTVELIQKVRAIVDPR